MTLLNLRRSAMTPACLLSLGLAAASAQSQTVTMYGLADLAVERLNHVGTAGSSLTRMPGLTGNLPSRLGFRGTEDLGDGLKAQFVLEMGLALDTGGFNQGGRAFGRQSWVGLGGPWGTVSFGRQYSMLFWSQTEADILGPSAYAAGSLDSYLPNARADNAVAWRGRFGALDLGATYSLGRDAVNAGPSPGGTNCAGESATDAQACRQWSAMVKYDTPTWGLASAIDEIRGGPGAFAGLTSSSLKDRRSTVAGWLRAGEVKLGAGLIARRNDASAATPKSHLWYAGVSYPLTPLLALDGMVYRLSYDNSANQATLAAVRASYRLSKRTAIYALAGHIANGGGLALSVSGTAAGGAPMAGRSQSGLATGIQHSF